ncbi:hypothetical protein LINGRAHAP2_LOCUS36416 [Linum grandiflorum]
MSKKRRRISHQETVDEQEKLDPRNHPSEQKPVNEIDQIFAGLTNCKVDDLSSFKLDIDKLLDQFSVQNSTRLADLKKLWQLRKLSYIYAAIPAANSAFFMQSLYTHTIGHMMAASLLSRSLGALYCLYCLYETQPFRPPFKVYLSVGELGKLKKLVAEASKRNDHVKEEASAVVKRMVRNGAFLFGFVDIGEAIKTVDELTELQKDRVKLASKMLFSDARAEQCLRELDDDYEVRVDDDDDD